MLCFPSAQSVLGCLFSLDEILRRFHGFGVDWWIAGGVAIDLFLGWETRRHDDVDIEMFRSDRDVLFDVFEGWDLHVVSEGQLVPWRRGDPIDDAVFGVWGRPNEGSAWAVEVILANGNGDTWRFRRDPSIALPRSRLTAKRGGIEYCTPEVQLLYKAKRARPKDDVDFARCLHHMTGEQRRWLRNAVAKGEPEHPWIHVLDSSMTLD